MANVRVSRLYSEKERLIALSISLPSRYLSPPPHGCCTLTSVLLCRHWSAILTPFTTIGRDISTLLCCYCAATSLASRSHHAAISLPSLCPICATSTPPLQLYATSAHSVSHSCTYTPCMTFASPLQLSRCHLAAISPSLTSTSNSI